MNLSINGIVRWVMIPAFAVSLIGGTGGLYFVLHERAIQHTAVEAGRLLTTATAIRSYTTNRVAPRLAESTGHKFAEETVPAFAAQTVYQTVQQAYPGYSYREPALKPTNPNNLPTPFEVDLINKFRSDPNLAELHGVHDEGDRRVYYLARPLRATESCLECHDTPQRAPPALVAQYGPVNGFGWKLNEIVAIQSLTVPAAEELRETGELAVILGAGLLVIFIVTYFALALSMDSVVARPLQALARAADAASLKSDMRTNLPASGAVEIRSISTAIERLRSSLAKALKRLQTDSDRRS
jgi:HAMP domain-containing protein